jgi:hypothetical protein
MEMKLGQSTKPKPVMGLDDWGGSKNSSLGAERFWIEVCSMVRKRMNERER